MRELNGNEKYFFLVDTLATDATQPFRTHADELMLYGDDDVRIILQL